MTERGILFSAPMVRALLAGAKTQTRRVIKPQPDHSGPGDSGAGEFIARKMRCPYGKLGDRLWVRETWQCVRQDKTGQRTVEGPPLPPIEGFRWIEYAATPRADEPAWKWRPSIHMPRWASRITLEVTGVRVERLQDISDEDAVREGVERLSGEPGCFRWRHYGTKALHDEGYSAAWEFPSNSYASLWESINGPGSWDANPWVWVVEFTRVMP